MSDEADTTTAADAGDAAGANPQSDATTPPANPGDAPAEAPADAEKGGDADGGSEKPSVPEKYDLKLPEGSRLDASVIERTAVLSRTLGLSNDSAQQLIEYAQGEITQYAEAQAAAYKETVNKWPDQVKADKEIGGDAYEQNVELARRVIKRFATPEFTKSLDESGYGNHPELVRVFVKIGKAMAEDTLDLPTQGPTGKRDPAQVLYGGNKSKE